MTEFCFWDNNLLRLALKALNSLVAPLILSDIRGWNRLLMVIYSATERDNLRNVDNCLELISIKVDDFRQHSVSTMGEICEVLEGIVYSQHFTPCKNLRVTRRSHLATQFRTAIAMFKAQMLLMDISSWHNGIILTFSLISLPFAFHFRMDDLS